MIQRCQWCTSDPEYINYHDLEWGVPVRDDQRLFEFITLEGAQAGLSWITILKRRQQYREAFDDFDIELIALYNKRRINSLLKNPGIIRNQRKIESTIRNAKALIELKNEFGSFAKYLWQYVDNKAIQNHWHSHEDIPAKTSLSESLSKALKKRGFSFVGPTIIYAFMQAVGMVNDHTTDCFRYRECAKLK